jgi:hypothetical protein
VYNKDVRKIRFDLMAHLHKMMVRQREEFEFEKEEEYVCSMVKPLYDLLNEVIINKHSPFINVHSKVRSIR